MRGRRRRRRRRRPQETKSPERKKKEGRNPFIDEWFSVSEREEGKKEWTDEKDLTKRRRTMPYQQNERRIEAIPCQAQKERKKERDVVYTTTTKVRSFLFL